MATYLEAAETILKEYKRPLSSEELTDIAIRRGLIIPGGPTPAKTMGALIYSHIKKHRESSPFTLVASNRFTLVSNNQLDLFNNGNSTKEHKNRNSKRPKSSKPQGSFRQIACIVLEEAGHPMTAQQITGVAIEKGLLTSVGKTPSATMSAKIYTEIQENGEDSIFIKVGRGLFFLRNRERDIESQEVNSEQVVTPPVAVPLHKNSQKKTSGSAYLDAAGAVLDEIGHPLTAGEIVTAALERGFTLGQSKTPNRALTTTIDSDIRKNGEKSLFYKVSRGLFSLRNSVHGEKPYSALNSKQPVTIQPVGIYGGNIAALQRELEIIQSFLIGRLEHRPSDEKLCDWVLFCYTAEMFSAGRDIFRLINQEAVNAWYFEKVRKLARLCSLKAPSNG